MRGFIRQRGTTYTAYWSATDPATGARRQHTKGGFATKKAATAHLNEVVGRVQAGGWRADQALTVRQLLEAHWLPAQGSRNLKPTTLAQYRDVVTAWIVPNIGALRVSSLTPADVQRLVEKLRTTRTSQRRAGLSPRSLQLTVGVLKSACSFAVKTGLLGRDPIAGVDRPRVEQRAPSVWSEESARAFLAATGNDRLASMWALALTRGMRRGELAGLGWDAVDLDAGSLAITKTTVMVDGHAQASTPKTSAGRRTVPLDSALVSLLRSRLTAQKAECLRAGVPWSGGYCFTDELGDPYSPDWISARFEQLLRAAELPRIRMHDTRHTAATLMLKAGTPVKVVSEMLGHASPTITLSIYAHVLPGMAEEAGAALSASLLG